jgi:hypothetical protein
MTTGSIHQSLLWEQLKTAPELQSALNALRNIVEEIAVSARSVVPSYTDHSVIHMDALWGIAERVLTKSEVSQFSAAEAFILGASFYIHDLGMALAATPDGMSYIQSSTYYSRAREDCLVGGMTDIDASRAALEIASRQLHAHVAERLVSEKFPGLDRFLLENTSVREAWGSYIEQVSASHHWTIEMLEEKLGRRGRTPAPNGEEMDLGYIACVLRIVDYAHVTWERARSLDRQLRIGMVAASAVHWNAQAHITGPLRDENQLVYGSSRDISDLESWWLCYEMMCGLDKEIDTVAEYLRGRVYSRGRFSLQGVQGTASPEAFARYIIPNGFEPIDVRFRPDSLKRLTELLGGRQLYGNDVFAFIRELLQNARDAIALQRATEVACGAPRTKHKISVELTRHDDGAVLTVSDTGVGMNSETIAKYLLGVASDYWNSQDYAADYPTGVRSVMRPVGKFGIGFLSVFMEARSVEVETERVGHDRILLIMENVGRRGGMRVLPRKGVSGTTVKLNISRESADRLNQLEAIVRAKAPMLDIDIHVRADRRTQVVRAGWWRKMSQRDILMFLSEHSRVLSVAPNSGVYRGTPTEDSLYPPTWPAEIPEVSNERRRILAHSLSVLVCAYGFFVTQQHFHGYSGLVDIGEVDLDAARARMLSFNRERFTEDVLVSLRPRIVSGLDALQTTKDVPRLFGLIVYVATVYGFETLEASALAWIPTQDVHGTYQLCSVAELERRVKASGTCFLAYGKFANPWGISALAHRFLKKLDPKTLMIGVPSSGQSDPPYVSEWRGSAGPAPFREHWQRSDVFPERMIPILPVFISRVIERAGDLPEGSLLEHEWENVFQTLCIAIRLRAVDDPAPLER